MAQCQHCAAFLLCSSQTLPRQNIFRKRPSRFILAVNFCYVITYKNQAAVIESFMPESFSAGERAGLTLLAQSALTRIFSVSLLLGLLWFAIYWAEAIL